MISIKNLKHVKGTWGLKNPENPSNLRLYIEFLQKRYEVYGSLEELTLEVGQSKISPQKTRLAQQFLRPNVSVGETSKFFTFTFGMMQDLIF